MMDAIDLSRKENVMSTADPYSVKRILEVSPPQSPDLDFGTILRRWERLRIVYNLMLIPWVIFLLCVSTGPPGIIIVVPFAGILANGLYLLGPAVEAYMTWFGFWHVSMTIGLFVAALASTAAAAAVAILPYPPF